MKNSPLFGGEIKELPPRDQNHDSGSGSGSPSTISTQDNGQFGGMPQPMKLEGYDFPGMPQFKPGFLSAESEPHTPVEQIPPPPFSRFETTHRFGSVSSIATTDDEDNASNEILYPWNEQQDDLVRQMYEDLLNSPQLTPFSGRYPPSGVLHRVAKDTLKMAKHKQIYFPHSMNAVRQRVIQYYHGEPETKEELQRYRVPSDYFNIPMSSQQGIGDMADEFDFSDAIGPSARRISVEEKYGQRQAGLQPAFKEPPPQQPLTEEDVVNIVAKRKRDSLRFKRGPH